MMLFRLLTALLILISLCTAVLTAEEAEIIQDMGDNEVILPDTVEKVVILDPFATQIALVIGAGDQLASVFLGPADAKVLHEVNPEVAGLKSVGGPAGTNMEALIALEPDLVISQVGSDKMNENIRNLQIPVLEVNLESPENLIKGIKIIGEATGKSENSEAFIDWYSEKMEYITRQTNDTPDGERKKVYLGGFDPLSTVGSDYYQHYLIENAGGENIAAEFTGGWNEVSLEQLYNWQPDIILFAPYSQITVEDLIEDPAWQKLTAVKEGHVYRMPSYISSWDVPAPESVLGMMWLAEKLYPEKINFKIEEEMKSFYKTFYGYDINDETISSILAKQSLLEVNPAIIT